MNIQYVYTKKRYELDRTTNFTDQPAEILAEIVPNYRLLEEFVYRNPVDVGIENSIEISAHEVNTTRYQMENKSIHHTEGGWPKDVNQQDQEQINRYRKKIEKDDIYLQSISRLIKDLEIDLQQNNAIDIHQNYFQEKINDNDNHHSFHIKTVNLYSWNSNRNQIVNHISWQSDGQRKIVVSYGNFSRMNIIDSLVWNIENPNQPEIILKSNSCSLNTVEFHPKDINQILAGCFNGQVCLFDLRKGKTPVEQSFIEYSHRESVKNIRWIQSKSGTEFISATMDGQIFWWDTKKLTEPIDKLILDLDKKERIQYAQGITALEYDFSIPTKFMVGTETGRVVLCTRKGKNDTERINVIYPGHYGSIHAIERHPNFKKIFLSLSDWDLRIWSEEIRDDYIFSTKMGKSYFTDAQWCPSRSAVFISSTTDGLIQFWDLLFKQDEPTLTVKLSEEPISCLSFEDQGRYLACGNENGNIILTELSDSLCISDRNEKQFIATIFDRETRRTRLLETRSRLKQTQQIRTISFPSDDQFQQSTEQQFWSIIEQEKNNK